MDEVDLPNMFLSLLIIHTKRFPTMRRYPPENAAIIATFPPQKTAKFATKIQKNPRPTKKINNS